MGQLLNGSEGLGSSAAASLEPVEPEPASSTVNLTGFLSSLATQQGRLQARAGLLENVVSVLSQGPAVESSDAPTA